MMKRNILLVVTLLSAVVYINAKSLDETKAAIRASSVECLATVGAEPADLENMFADSTDMKSKCVRNCIMRQYKVIADDGSLSKDGLIFLAKHLADGSDQYAGVAAEVAEICGAIKESDPCEGAYKYGMCMKKEMKNRGITIPLV